MSRLDVSLADKENFKRQAELERQQRLSDLKAKQEANKGLGNQPHPQAQPAPFVPAPFQAPLQGQVSKPVTALSIEDLQNELYKRKQEINDKVKNIKLDANDYRVNIPSLKLLLDDKPPGERQSYAGSLSVMTNVPIIIVLAYIGEVYGFTPQIEDNIKRLMDFYTVQEVLNVKRPE